MRVSSSLQMSLWHTCVPPPVTWVHVCTHKTFYVERPWPWIGTMSRKEHIILLRHSARCFITMMTGVIKDNTTEPGQLFDDATCRKYQVLMWHVVDTFNIKANRSSQKHKCEWEPVHRGVTSYTTQPKDNRTSEDSRFHCSQEALKASMPRACIDVLQAWRSILFLRLGKPQG